MIETKISLKQIEQYLIHNSNLIVVAKWCNNGGGSFRETNDIYVSVINQDIDQEYEKMKLTLKPTQYDDSPERCLYYDEIIGKQTTIEITEILNNPPRQTHDERNITRRTWVRFLGLIEFTRDGAMEYLQLAKYNMTEKHLRERYNIPLFNRIIKNSTKIIYDNPIWCTFIERDSINSIRLISPISRVTYEHVVQYPKKLFPKNIGSLGEVDIPVLLDGIIEYKGTVYPLIGKEPFVFDLRQEGTS